MSEEQLFNKAQAEWDLTLALQQYAEAIGIESITAMTKSIEEEMHKTFRFANVLIAEKIKEAKRAEEYMDKVEDDGFTAKDS
jgi:heterodisulfide reductase subunit C